MTLNTALYGAMAGVSVASAQISTVSRNIANQSNPNASRKIANVVTANGLPAVASISQASNTALLTSLLSANSNQAQQSAISNAMTQLQSTLGTSSSDSTSPTALIGQLSDALQTYADSPQSSASAQAAVQAATNLANGLNSASTTVQNVREQADTGIANSVNTINNILGQFTQVNQTIMQGTQSGADITDALDQRNSLLQQLSNQIGITTVKGSNNSVKIYTSSGLTLFDQTPMTVTFKQTPAFTASTQGNAVYVDGVPVTASGSPYSVQSGALAGLDFGPGQPCANLPIAARSDRGRFDHRFPGDRSERRPTSSGRAGWSFHKRRQPHRAFNHHCNARPRCDNSGFSLCEPHNWESSFAAGRWHFEQ